jgi:SMI1-KNR4 cell-wall
MSEAPKLKLQPYAGCQWNIRSADDQFYWEEGGCSEHKDGFGPTYVLIAPEHFPITTIGLRSENCRKGFDYLYLRIGALEACYLPIEAGQTTFIFVEKQRGWKSSSLIRLWKKPFSNEFLSKMNQLMHEEAPPSSVAEIRSYFMKHQDRDLKALIPLKPYQQHRYVYRGLKLGEYLSDHVDADPALLIKLEEKTKSHLPTDYRSFILETNGGHLKNQVFLQAKGMKKPKRLLSFVRFDAKSNSALPKSHFKFGPSGFLRFASLDNYHDLFLGIHESIHGKVYWVSPKAYEAGFENRTLSAVQRANLSGVKLLAGSFSEFIQQLEVTDELA